MAVQVNGITVVSVIPDRRVIHLLVGNVEIALRYRAGNRRFSELHRSYTDGRRDTGHIRIPDAQWRDMMRQLHGIAQDRGWKT